MCSYQLFKNKFLGRLSLILIIILITLSLSSCSINNKEAVSKSTLLLNTIITITLYGEDNAYLIDDAFDLIKEYENIYSRSSEDSELYKLNHGLLQKTELGYEVSPELYDLIDYSLFYSELSRGAFDITIGPLSELWRFSDSNPTVPNKSDIENSLSYVNYKDISLNNNHVSFKKEGMSLDLGAIAKGYIADRVKDFLISKGIDSGIINLGGNILTIASKPDGSPYDIGVQKPFADRNETIAIMEISDYTVVSSGIYERAFTEKDVLYHHILDPSDGFPYDNDLISVTIITKDSVDGDGLSTVCYALGLKEGLDLIENVPDTYAVFVTQDYEVHYSEGFLENIKTKEVK